MAEKITQEQIEAFIDGHDPQERIVNLMYDYDDTFVRVIYRNENDKKCESREDFYPFCWATRMACERLCHGDRELVKKLLGRYGIGVKKLSQTDVDGNVRHEFDDGYLFMLYAKSPMSYRTFLQFFKDADNPVYNNKKDNTQQSSKAESRQYLCVTPQEQFMISTGKRFFKGYDDYDQILRMTFDLETTGLNTEKDRIIQIGVRINRPFPGYPNGFEKIINIDGDTEEEKDKCELWAIEQMLKMIQAFQPDVITAHNGENFDWNMIIGACKRLGVDFEEFSAKYFRGKGIKKEDRDTVLKLGGEIEYYKATIVPGIIVTDSLHAVRRAQALDSNMLKADLKYVTEYSEMKKPNRVYVPGATISKVEKDLEEHYAFNDENGDWYLYDPNSKNGGEDVVLGKKNYIPKRNVILDGYELKSGQYIVERYLFDDLWECDKVEHRYNTPNFLVCKMIPVPYKKCTTMGTAGQWKSLMMAWSYEQGLAIPMFGESKRFTGGLSRLLRVGFVKNVVKLDFNSLYPSIILTWGITDPIDLMNAMLYFLEHVLTQREKYKGLKKKAGKAAGKIKEKIENKEYSGKEEEKQLNSEMLRLKADESFNDKKQLPLKIFGNSFFGSYGAPDVFPWGSLKCAEQVTCTGRQCLRLMISHFHNIGYEPIVGDTDGFNFQLPDESQYRYTEENPYISPGLSRETEAGKKYVGFRADVAEFNDVYMCDKHYAPNAVNKMGLGIDEVVSATINFSRKNYADYFPEEKYPKDVKMVGNTIKSKKMPEYIAKFLAKGIRLLLQGNGQGFLNEYYDYVEKIYNYQIPLRDIASKGKIKKSIAEYLRDVQTLTKAGRPKSRQAWYELAITNNLTVNNGDTIYYVNTGKAKSHSDIKKIKKYFNTMGEDETKKIESEFKKAKKDEGFKTMEDFMAAKYPDYVTKDEVIFNCLLVPANIIDKEEDTYCSDVSEDFEYNVAKYVDQFNKRITPLLVCFSTDIRSNILITNPKDRPYFTKEQCMLTSGQPNKPGDQDTYEQLMTMEDKEIKFWTKYNLVPPFFEECGMGNWEETVKDYERRMEEERINGIAAEKEYFQEVLCGLEEDELDSFIEDGELPPAMEKIVELDPLSTNFVSKKHEGAVIGNIDDFINRKEEIKTEKENKE